MPVISPFHIFNVCTLTSMLCASVLDSVGAPWDSTENIILCLASPLLRIHGHLQFTHSQLRNDRTFLEFYLVCQGRNKKKSTPDNNTQVAPGYSWETFLWKGKLLCAFAHCFLCLELPSFLHHPTNSYSFTHIYRAPTWTSTCSRH